MDTINFNKFQRINIIIGFIGLFLFAMTAYYGKDGHDISIAILFLYTTINIKKILVIAKKNKIIQYIIFLNIYIFIRSMFSFFNYNENYAQVVKDSFTLFAISGIPSLVISTLINKKEKNIIIIYIFSLSLLSFLLNIVQELNWSDISSQLNNRPHMGTNANVFGYLCLFNIITFVTIIAPYILNKNKNKKYRFLLYILSAIIVIILLEGIVASQSRTTWLAFCLIILFTTIYIIKNTKMKNVFIYIIIISILIGFLLIKKSTIISRINSELDIILKLSQGDTSALDNGSISKRIYMWRLGKNKIVEKPIFGWGPASSEYLFPRFGKKSIMEQPHYHNVYLEILLSLGIFGFFIWLFIVIHIIKLYNKVNNKNCNNNFYYLFFINTLFLFIIYGLFEWGFQHPEARFPLIMFFAIGLAANQHIKISKQSHYNE